VEGDDSSGRGRRLLLPMWLSVSMILSCGGSVFAGRAVVLVVVVVLVVDVGVFVVVVEGALVVVVEGAFVVVVEDAFVVAGGVLLKVEDLIGVTMKGVSYKIRKCDKLEEMNIRN
jgi:hypothetical protein